MTEPAKVALITGAGSGVGQAIAIRLARAGWQVALTSRRLNTLQQTADEIQGQEYLLFPCDIGRPAEVEKLSQAVLDKFGRLDVLVNAAGTNTPNRSLEKLSLEDFHRIVDTNLYGAYLCVKAFLPLMRKQGGGTIVNIVSEAGIRANSKAGPAYVVSKFGLAGLNQAINAEEREHGIRACAIFPGDINTPILDLRPVPPPADARQKMLQAEDVADCAMLVINMPGRAIVEELVIRPA